MRLSVAARAAFIYALFGALWILTSDRFVELFISGELGAVAQTIKGLVYIALTSTMVYGLVWHAQRRQRRDEQRFRNLFDTSPDALLLLDDSGVVSEANLAATFYFGLPMHELIGSTYDKLTAHERLVEQIEAIKWTPGRLARIEVELPIPDGTQVPVEIVAKTIEEDRKKKILVIIRDMSAIKQATAELEASEHRYRTYVNDAPVPIIFTSLDAHYTHANQAACNLLGYTETELVGLNIFHMIPEKEREEAANAFEQFLTTGGFVGEVQSMRKDGSTIELLVSAFMPEPGQCMAFLTDITERKVLEQQVQHAARMEAVGRLAGGVAHDLNNLLQVVNGYAELVLSDDGGDVEYRRSVEKIMGAGNRAAALVRQLLAFSRKQSHSPCPVNANLVITDLLKLIGRTIGEDIEVSFTPETDPALMMADTGQLEQVLINLCVNARDAMPSGGKLCIVTSRRQVLPDDPQLGPEDAPGDYIVLSVSDTGHGMDEDTQQRLFEPFFTTKALGHGTGLGLSIVYGLVKQHGGFITVISEPGDGARFDLYFPATSAEASHGVKENAPVPANGTETILLSEDDDNVRDYVVRVLESSGYEVIVTSNGLEAVEAGRAHCDKLSLAILDLVMPVMGGRAVQLELLNLCPDLPILFMSGYDPKTETDHTAGPDERILHKPFGRHELLNTVRTILDLHAGTKP